MTSAIPGIVTVILITLGAGLIAYIGDRVGHQVGRRRLTLFGLRPKYTSTIVAVSTGMIIALSLTLAALAASQYVRQAVFRISSLNDRINELQDQATRQQAELGTTRNASIVLQHGTPITPQFLTLRASQPADQQRKALTAYFDQTVKYVNATYARKATDPGALRPYEKRATDPAVQNNFTSLIDRANAVASANVASAIVILSIADVNLFPGDRITFGFLAYPDRRIARDGDVLASIDVRGGAPGNFLGELVRRAQQTAVERGMPPQFVVPPFIDQTQAEGVAAQVLRAHGRVRVVAKAGKDTYPHAPPLELDFSIVGAKR
jgi:hypothetical protein